MPVNIDPSVNPEKIPHLTFVPQIALPSVFNDALSYTEVLGKVVATVNKSIDNVNEVAENMTEQLIQTLTGAKLPEYFNIIHNGSEMIDLDNWTIDNPAGLYTAVGEGKLCILAANVAFDGSGNAIPYPDYHVKFILAQVSETVTSESVVRSCCFYNMNYYNTIRLAVFNLTKTAGSVTCECMTFNERSLITEDDISAFQSVAKDKLMVYKGDVAFPQTDVNYIELTSYGVLYDLAPLFCVTDGTHLIAGNVCPCIVIDKKTGFVGEMRYGGNTNPWVRIYGTGVQICSQAMATIATLSSGVLVNSQNIENLNTALGNLSDAVEGLGVDVSELDSDSVKYTQQTKTNGEKEIARGNIGAVAVNNPVVNNTLMISNRDDAADVKMGVYVDNGANILDFKAGESAMPVLRNVASPTSQYDVANRKYVDENSGADAVKYVAQNPDNVEKSIARNNIGALEKNEPLAYDNLSIINQVDNAVITAEPTIVSGATVVNLSCTIGDSPRIANVATPVNDSDVATKAYVDANTAEGCVRYDAAQVLTSNEKNRARLNIDAVQRTHGSFVDFFTIDGSNSSFIGLAIGPGGDGPALSLSNSDNDPVSILNVGPPVNQNGCANKQYVDETAGYCVKYNESQSLSDLQKEQARNNIGSAAKTDAEINNHVKINSVQEDACVILVDVQNGNTGIVHTKNDLKVVKNYEAFPEQGYVETLQKVTVADPTEPANAATKRYVDNANSIITIKCDGETGNWSIYFQEYEQRWLYSQLMDRINSGARVRLEYNITEQSDTVTTECIWWGTSVIGMGAMMNTEDGMVVLNLASDKTFTASPLIPS